MSFDYDNVNINSIDPGYWRRYILEYDSGKVKPEIMPWQAVVLFQLDNGFVTRKDFASIGFASFCDDWCMTPFGAWYCCGNSQHHELPGVNDLSAFGDYMQNLLGLININPYGASIFAENLKKNGSFHEAVEVYNILPSLLNLKNDDHVDILEKSWRNKAEVFYRLGDFKEGKKSLDMAYHIGALMKANQILSR